MVASHTEKPLGFSNQRSLFAKRGKVNGWLGRYTYNPLLLCKGHDEACRKPKGLHFIYPYLNQPFRCPQWGSCIAGYYHLMPTASAMQALLPAFWRTRANSHEQVPSVVCSKRIETSPTNKKSPMPKHRGLLLNRSGLQFLS